MDCGIEEYPMRTVGYSATVMTDMILGLEIGLYYHHLSNKEYDHYIASLLHEIKQFSNQKEKVSSFPLTHYYDADLI